MNKKELQEQKKQLAFIKGNLAEIDKLYQRLGDQNPFEGMDTKDFLDPENFKLLSIYLSDAKKEANSLFGAMDQVKEEVDEIFSGLNAVTDEITKGKQGFALTKKTMKSLTGIMGDVKDITDGIVDGNSEDLEKLLTKAKIEEKNLIESQRLLALKAQSGEASAQELIALDNLNAMIVKNADGVAEMPGLYESVVDSITKVKQQEEELEDKMGNVGVAVKAVGGALDKLGMGALGKAMGLDDALKNTKKLQKEALASGEPFNAMTHLTKEVGTNMTKAFGPLAIGLALLNQMVKAFKIIDGASGEIAKSQGISAAEGREIVMTSQQQASATGDILVSTKDIVAAQQSLNALLGTSVQYPAQMAVDMNTMSEKLGLSAEAQNFFAKNQIKSSKGIGEQLQDVSDITTQLNQQSGLSINQKQIQEGISKLSASQRLAAKGSTKELANQVYQSKLLGLEAADLEGVQNSLLDFESSIAAEMEAELMTGKQLNLEGARAAALRGDQAALAAEIRKEVGDINEFEEMNVLQRQAMAKAFGLNIDQMAEMLEKQKVMEQLSKGGFKSQSKAQEAYNALVDEGMSHEEALADMKLSGIDDALAAQMKSTSQSEKMNALTEKFMDLFISIAGPIADLLDPIISALSTVLIPTFRILQAIITPIVDSLQGMFDIISAIFDPSKSISDVFEGMGPMVTFLSAAFTAVAASVAIANIGLIKQGVLLAIAGIKAGILAASTMATAAASTLGIGMPTILIAIAAGVAAVMAAKSKMKDGMIGPGGETIVSGPKGSIQLDKQDSMVVGTNLGGDGGQSNDSGEVVRLLKELITAVNSGGDVFLDGNKVGQSLALSTSNMGN